jgi:hypothetical protein
VAKKGTVSTVNIEFRKAPSYNITPATGAWCTKTTNGQILCDFLVESEETPMSLVLGISDKGAPTSEETRNFSNGAPGFIRTFISGVVMTPEVALMVGQLLIETVQGNQ